MMKNVDEPDDNLNELDRDFEELNRRTREEIRTGEFAGRVVSRSNAEVLPFDRGIGSESSRSLLPKRQSEDLQARWSAIQNNFVDEPRRTVEEADKLIETAIHQVQDSIAAERSKVDRRWRRGEDVSTEELRMCLQSYRALFNRLVSW
jgi:hypothetical protein